MKVLMLQIVLLSTCASAVYSISVFNNATVSSDILSEIFLNSIIWDDNYSALNISESQNCFQSLFLIISELRNSTVNRFLDSWGKIPSGLEYGNLYDPGNFDQCIKTSVKFNELQDEVVGKFCFAKIPLHHPLLKKNIVRLTPLPDKLDINIGICIPDSCSPEFMTSIFKKADTNDRLAGIHISNCTNGKMPPIKLVNIIGIAVFSIFALLMVLGSIFDYYNIKKTTTPGSILVAFSIFANGQKLFAINTSKSQNTIECLPGIRVLSMLWIITFHTYLVTTFVPLMNEIDNQRWSRTWSSMYLFNAGMGVDSFFFASGLLVAWTGFKSLDSTKGKLNVGMMYIHRYIRLTPVVAATILYVASVSELVYTGPFRDNVLARNPCNGNNWWPNLLYIQNYYIPYGMCNNESWYLAIDFQLYILSPLLLIPLWKWGIKFSPVFLILALLSVGIVMGTFITKQFSGLLNVAGENKWETTYIPTHARYPPWLIGFALGYFMHTNRQSAFRIPKILQQIAWGISLLIWVGIVFGPYFTANGRGSVVGAAFYGGWKHFLWGIALAWTIFACHFGFGGIINSFLSHPFWQPLSRLTYSMYLTHMIVLQMQMGMMRQPVHFSNNNEIFYFYGGIGISFTVSIFVALAFEYPVFVLEKFIFRRK